MKKQEEYTPWNPNPEAVAMVKDIIPEPEECMHCGGVVALVNNSEIYGGKSFGPWPWAFICTECKAYVGLHSGTGFPLGTLADGPTREARRMAKKHFNDLLATELVSRTNLYTMLADLMNIPRAKCHFAMFTVKDCLKVKGCLATIKDTHLKYGFKKYLTKGK